uniref:UDP-glucuronosyltransferase n=1 Tax=Zygaena filipendulae TaxID=287375 RepID=D2JLL0_9NEOP|nr:UGT39A1 [Zygaena filipendulae]
MSPVSQCVFILCYILLLVTTISESSKILYITPYAAKSHYIGTKDLGLELAKRGHDVYVITPYKEINPPPTYHQLMVEPISIWESLFDKLPNTFELVDFSFASFQMLLYRSGFYVNELVFNSTDVQDFLKQDHEIDLVISELFYNEALYMFAHKYQAPLVLVTTFGNALRTNYFSRNPLQLSTAYHEYGMSSDPFSFMGRLYNLYYFAFDMLMHTFWYLPRQQEYARFYFKDLPEPVPSLKELAGNAALVLMNSHFSVDTPLAYLPNFIEIGGIHLQKSNKSLPEDLQKALDEAKNGVVYLSFGSNVQSSDLAKDKLDAFLKVFGELKQTVLMKWEDTELANAPKNVLLRQWLPQKEILAHPNVKLFIGHGGLLGSQETMSAGVPILGIPVFCDQYLNILQMANNGHGELLEYKYITEESLRKVINKMLNDDRYLKRAREISIRFKDRPMPPLETALWWIEYVIRHKGAEFMKTPTLQMNYFAYHMLDVYLFLAFITFMIVFSCYKLSILGFKK